MKSDIAELFDATRGPQPPSLTLRDAIVRHRGEASGVTDRFQRLRPSEQQALVEFLKSL